MAYTRVLARMRPVSCETNQRTCGTCTIGLQSVIKCDHILNLFFTFFLVIAFALCTFCVTIFASFFFHFLFALPRLVTSGTTFALFSFYVRLPCLLFFNFRFTMFALFCFCHHVCPFFFDQSQRPSKICLEHYHCQSFTLSYLWFTVVIIRRYSFQFLTSSICLLLLG